MQLVSLIAAFACFGVIGEPVITVGRQKQLFLDDYLIESRTNIKRVIHPAQKYEGNPVLWATESWEPELNVLYGSVIQDEGISCGMCAVYAKLKGMTLFNVLKTIRSAQGLGGCFLEHCGENH